MRALFTRMLTQARATRGFYYTRKLRRRLGLTREGDEFIARHGLRVLSGPFAGLEYPPDVANAVDAIAPKLLGAYERELHEALEVALAQEPKVVVNVGCADGYYAVGCALRLPTAEVHAFDAVYSARQQCAKVARINSVDDRVELGRWCDYKALKRLNLDGALVISDCEGCEDQLFEPRVIELLHSATVVVELHEMFVPGVERSIPSRFSATHTAEIIPTQEREADTYPELGYLKPKARATLITEYRPPMNWCVCTPQ